MDLAPTVSAFLLAGCILQLAGWVLLLRARRGSSIDDAVVRDRRLAPSRAAFDRLAHRERERAAGIARDLTLATLDIDGLAARNDALGYAAGDLVIGVAERAILGQLRRIDTVVSNGGGAWSVLLPDLTAVEARDRVEAMRVEVQRALALDECAGAPATISAGIAYSLAGATPVDDLQQCADQACIAAQLGGGARSRAWSEAVRDDVRRSSAHRSAQRDVELATVLALAEALDLRDADTSNHSRQVGRYAELMAQELGLPPAHVERVRVAGLLHDIGKIGVPDSVLRKPGKLDDEEWAMMQRHPEIGARLLASVDAEDIRSWVVAHHERPDGRGYPLGLTDAEIPLEAKILAAADAYEAMTADRVYRKAPGPRIARAELDRWRGAQFDDAVVDAFITVLDELEPLPAETAEPAHDELRRAA
ncbi:MAG: domain/HD domain protein [Thermoleophilia bacterium]|nr:domain/HD domain protein [Thermoleophilia bacterium]